MTAPRRWHCTSAFVNTLKDIRRHIGTTASVGALLALPLLFASLAQWRIFGGDGIELRWILVTVPMFLLGLFTTGVWLNAAIIHATGEFAKGMEPGIGSVLGKSLVRIPSLLGIYLMIFVLEFAAFLLAATPALGVFLIGGGPSNFEFSGGRAALMILSILIGLFVFAGALFVLYFRFAMAPPAAVLEGTPAFRSLTRSRDLMRGRWVDYFLLGLILAAVASVVGAILIGPAYLISLGSMFSGEGMSFRPGLVGAGFFAVSTYLTRALTPLLVTGASANFFLALRGDEVVDAALQAASGPAGNDEPDANQDEKTSGQDEHSRDLSE